MQALFALDASDQRAGLRARRASVIGGTALMVDVAHGDTEHRVLIACSQIAGQVTLLCSCRKRDHCVHGEFALVAVQANAAANEWLRGRMLATAAEVASERGAAVARPAQKPALASIEDRELEALDDWLHSLEMTRNADPNDSTKRRKEKVALFFCAVNAEDGLEVEVWLAEPKKAGGYKRTRKLDLSRAVRGKTPLPPADLGLVAALHGHSSEGWRESVSLRGGGAGLVRTLIETGRCFVTETSPPLTLGERRRGSLAWVVDQHGTQSPALAVEGDALPVLLDEPMYLTRDHAQLGPLDVDLPMHVIRGFLAGPQLRPETTQRVAAATRAALSRLGMPEPKPLVIERRAAPAPTPHLVLYSMPVKAGYFLDAFTLDGAHLRFEYGSAEFLVGDDSPSFRQCEGERVVVLARDQKAEAAAVERLHASGFRSLLDTITPKDQHAIRPQLDAHYSRHDLTLNKLVAKPDAAAWQAFLQGERGALVAAGWRVEIDPSFRHGTLQASAWFVRAKPVTGNEWFELEIGIDVGEERVDLMPILLHMMRAPDQAVFEATLAPDDQRQVAVNLGDGRRVMVSARRLQSMFTALIEMQAGGKVDGQRMQLRRLLAPQVLALEGQVDRVEWKDDGALRELAQKLRSFDKVAKVAVPKALRADLRAYQREGLAWLQFLREHALGGILADDMGLGKTVQALAHIAVEKASGRMDRPCLVVSPTSVVANWAAEAERFTPDLSVLVLHGAARAANFSKLAEVDLVLTTYPLVLRDLDVLRAQPFHLLIADEAQVIKNARAKVAQALRGLDARHRLCLTGTPLENNLAELWAQFDFLMPGVLGDARSFGQVFRGPIERGGDDARRQALVARIRPFILRRTKATVASELPPKTEVVHAVEIEGAQRDLYETIRLSVHERVRQTIAEKGLAQAQIVILDALLKLRQVCCDPRLVKLDAAKEVTESAKLDALFDLLQPLVAEGRRILLFSQFTSMLALIEAELSQRAIGFVKLTGDTKDRKTPVARFQAGKVPVFLISLKAGGTGLNLTAADTVIHYDPWWNPAAEQQATDRAHRIGQDKPVFVFKLIASGTVEERIGRLQERKRALAAGILDGGDRQGAALTKADVEALFAAME